jgi:mannosyltransferase
VRAKLSSRVWLFVILLAAFALRLYRLGAASLWYDETVSMALARQDLLALTRHTAGDIHPPLYYYLLHFWGQLAGWSEFSAAFLSLCFGMLLLALVYHVAREWLNKRVAFLAALFVAFSPYNLWYSQEVRMYTIGAALGLASVYLGVRVLIQTTNHRPPAVDRRAALVRRDFIAYVIVSALGLYTLYYFAFLLIFENLTACVWAICKSKIENRKLDLRLTFYFLRVWILSQLAILILYAPWLPIAFRQATDPPVPPWRSFTALPSVLLESFAALALGQSADPISMLPALFFVVVIIAFAFIADRNSRLSPDVSRFTLYILRITPIFLLSYTLIPLVIIYALSLWMPLYHVRYVFTYSPAFYILLAVGFDRVRNARFAIRNLRLTIYLLLCTLYFLLCAFSVYNFWFNPRYAKDDLRGAVRYLAEHWRPDDAILINAGYTYTAFVYYDDQPIAWRGRLTDYTPRRTNDGAVVLQTGSIGGSARLGWGNPESDFYATTVDETRAALDRVFAAHPRVWMLRLYDTVVDSDGIIRDYLATRGRIIDDQGFAGESYARVQGYLTTRAPLATIPATATHREILLGNRIALLGFEPGSITVRAGAPLDVNLYWQAQQPTNLDQQLYIGLFAQDGTVVASTDEIPIGNALGTTRWAVGEILHDPVRLSVPKNTAPGNYVLRAALYNPRTNETLAAPPGTWIAENDQIILTNVRVEK